MRNTHKAILIGLGIAAMQLPALATKPCPPSPCEAAGGTIDLAQCRSVADWVATGTITSVVHHREGYPTLKDFAEFTFTVETWEKGTGQAGRKFRFRVGWCDNAQPLPKDTSGIFRFFGLPLPNDPSVPNQYLHFEPVMALR